MRHTLPLTRRELLHLAAITGFSALVPTLLRAAPHHDHAPHRGPHPTPRPDYTADKVLAADQLGGDKELIALFDGIRKIPQVADGIRCSCGCAELPGFYSLLSCFEGKDAMAKWCTICAGTGALVIRLHGRGRTLDQIREAVDARF
jgi:hypothetical protein